MIRTLLQQTLRYPAVTAHCIKGIVSMLMSTCRYEVHGVEHLLEGAAKGPCLLLLWHDRLVPIANMLKKEAPSLSYHAVVSGSKDGKILAHYTMTFPQAKVISVPHWGRITAVKAMTTPLQGPGNVVVATPDGPRGPRHIVKKGVIKVAQMSQAQIIPLHWHASEVWQLGSWDRLAIPKPFSKITFTFGDPFIVPHDCSLEEGSDLLGRALDSMRSMQNG